MTSPRRPVLAPWLGCVTALWGIGCNAILGISEDPIVVSPPTKSCLLKSECKEAEICLFARCSVPCAANRDCDQAHGERCLKVDEGTACVSNDATECGTNSLNCPAGTSCVGGKCLSTCGGDAGTCPDDQVCASDNACHGGEVGRRPDAGVVDPSCVGHQPNDSFCAGAARIVCGADLVSAQTTECKTSAYCTSVTTGCAACLDNEFVCNTNKLMKCKPDHSGFELSKTCDDPNAPCSAQAGDCTSHACSPLQKRCNGDKLEQCNADQSAFVLLETCAAGLCDSQALQCGKCAAKAATCSNGMVRTCSDDGQTQTDKPCPMTSPFCIGNGTCVECLAPTNCVATNAPVCDATLFTCRGCKPGSPPTAGDAECNARYGATAPACTGSGACAECTATNATQCKGATPLCDISTNSCAECLASSSCSGSKPICAGGLCSACANDAQCSAKGIGLNGCQMTTGTCVQCVSNANCGGSKVCQSNNTCCTPDATSVTCGASTCGSRSNNCGVATTCGSCSAGTFCCTNAANLGVYNCRSLACPPG